MLNNIQTVTAAKNQVDRYAIYSILFFVVVHFLVAGQFGLSPDEAHYAMYGFHPALSYFDHPPLVGWLQSIILTFSSSDFSLRIWPILLSGLTMWNLYRLTQELFSEESVWLGLYSVLLVQSAIVYHLLALALVPETPLMLFSLLAYRYLLKAIDLNTHRYWLGFGFFLGLAGLSKYTAVTLIFSIVILLLSERRIKELYNYKMWQALFVAAILISPVFYWNAINDWISFKYQINHGTGSGQWSVVNFLTGVLGQIVASGPLLFSTAVFGVYLAFSSPKMLGRTRLLILALPNLLLFNWNSGYVPALPHWTSFGWLVLAPIAVLWLMKYWPKRTLRIGTWSALIFSYAIIFAVHLLLVKPALELEQNKNPFAEFHGWDAAMQKAVEIRDSLRIGGEQEPHIFIGSWTLASRLAWYGRPEHIMVTDRRFDQFDIWFGSPQKGDRGVFIEWSVFPAPPHSEARGNFFDKCELVDKLDIYIDGRMGAEYTYSVCEGYRP